MNDAHTCVEKDMVRLVVHDERWAALFDDAASEIEHILGTHAKSIQHIGSTSIKGIVAKPILDMAVIVRDFSAIDFENMKAYGYIHKGEAGIPGRSFFVRYRDGNISTHHIHCYKSDNPNLLASIAFRDYLIAHPEYAQQYSDLKLRLADMYPKNREAYTDAKSEFIKMVLQLARSSV